MKTVFKVILIGLGGIMLLGGGICTATNTLFFFNAVGARGAGEGTALFVILGGISAAVAALGIFLIKVGSATNDDDGDVRDAER